jgi:hypothetical protein
MFVGSEISKFVSGFFTHPDQIIMNKGNKSSVLGCAQNR